MCAFSCQGSIVKDKDQVCLLNTGRTLGYQECGYIPVKSVEGFAQCCVCCEVKGAGTVIQDQDFRFFHKGAGDGESLLLTAGKILSVLFQNEIKLAWLAFYDFFSLCGGKCLPQIVVSGIFPAPFQVIADRTFKKGCLLQNDTDSGTEVVSGISFDILTIQKNGSLACVIESGDQVDQSGFTTSGTADDTNSLTFFYRKTDV